MRSYLVVTGVIFTLLTILHVWKIIAEWNGFGSSFWIIAGLTLVTAILAIWAWWLLRGRPR